MPDRLEKKMNRLSKRLDAKMNKLDSRIQKKFGGYGASESTDYLARTDKANENALNAFAELGLTEDFEKSQKPGIIDNIKSAGSNVLDVLSRPEYATAAGIDTGMQGGGMPDILKAAGTELLSGIGDIQGKKQSIPNITKKYSPGYKEFSEEHPIASIGTDLGLSILGDPTSFIPAAAIEKGVSKLGKPVKAATKAIGNIPTGNKSTLADDIGKTFNPAYKWVKGAGEQGQKGYDILWSEAKKADAMKSGLHQQIKPAIEEVATWDTDKAKDLIRVMYGDKFAGDTPEVQDVANTLRPFFRSMGRRENRYLGKDVDNLLTDYMPNSPKAYTDLMENAGDYLPSGHGRGLADWKRGFEKEKVLKTGEDFLSFLKNTGVKDEDLPEIIISNVMGRAGQSVSRIRQIRTQNKLTKELPDVFRELPIGTKTVWGKNEKTGEALLNKGESIWMPAGNLRFFPQKIKDIIGKDITDALNDTGGVITPDTFKKISQAIDATTRTVIKTTTSGGAETAGPLKRLEDVVTDALESRGMSKGEAGVYINKLKGGGGAGNLTTTIDNITTVDKNQLSFYIAHLIDAASNNGAKVTPKMLEKLNKVIMGVTTNVKAYAVPVDILDDITKVSTRLGNTDNAIKYFDKAIDIFKNTAILSPGFHLRNFISSAAQNYLYDVDLSSYKDAIKVLATKNNNLDVLGKPASAWRKQFDNFGITGGSFVGQDVGKVNTKINTINKAFDVNRAFGGNIENLHRTALFVDRVKKGDSFMDAAKAVKKVHFDYNELTDIERNIFRRLMPFYSWSRKNIPYMIDRILNNPKKMRNIAKFKEAVSGGNENQNTPEWWKSQDVWQTKFTNKNGEPYSVSMGLPYAELNQVFDNPTGSLGIVGAAGNIIRNYDPYYDRKIKDFTGQTEPFIQIGDKTLRVDPQIKYAIEHIIPVAKRYGTDLSMEISKIAQGKADDDTKFKALSKLVGIRILPLTKDKQEKERIYKLQKQIMDYKKKLKQEDEIKSGQ